MDTSVATKEPVAPPKAAKSSGTGSKKDKQDSLKDAGKNNHTRKRAPVVLGNCANDGESPFEAAPPPKPKKRLFLDNISRGPKATPVNIRNYVKTKTGFSVNVLQTNHTDAPRLSFVVEIAAEEYDTVADPSIWPVNTHIREFFGGLYRFKMKPGGNF